MHVDTGLSLCQEMAETKLEAKVSELQHVMEEVKMLKDSVQQETEQKNKLQAVITDKDVCLERAVADTDRLKTQLAEKEEQVGFGLQVGHGKGKRYECRAVVKVNVKVEQVRWGLAFMLDTGKRSIVKAEQL